MGNFVRSLTINNHLLSLVAIILLGASLRLFRLGAKGLWLDEAFSVWMASWPVSEILDWIIRIDQHPPLYYSLLHFWLWLDDSATTVRALSALFGILTLPVIYLLGRRLMDNSEVAGPVNQAGIPILTGQKIALFATLILAISPFHIRFAQETRMYTLLTLNASLAMLALVHLLTDPQAGQRRLGQQLASFLRRRSKTEASAVKSQTRLYELAGASTPPLLALINTDLAWLGYIFFTTATMLTHNTALFFPVAANLFVLGLILVRRNRLVGAEQLHPPSLKNWLTAQLAILLLWSPWFIPFIIQSIGVYREFWLPPPDFNTVIWTVTNLLSVFLPGQLADQFDWTDIVWLIYALIFGLGLAYLRRRPAHRALLLILFLTPFVGEWLVSLRRPIFYDRTLIWSSIPLYLLLAAGLAQLRSRFLTVGLLFLVVINSLSLYEYFFRFEKEQWDDAAAYIAQQAEPDDLLLFNATWVQIPFDFYFRDYEVEVAKHGVPADLFEKGVLEPKMTPDDLPRLRQLIQNRDRVWLIYSHDWYTDAEKLIPKALAEDLILLERKTFYGLEVYLYQGP
jgi:hypothetical protein